MKRGRKPKDCTGPITGTMLTGIKPAGREGAKLLWEFRCECGQTIVRPVSITCQSGRRRTKSCGCLNTAPKRRNSEQNDDIVRRSNAGQTIRQIGDALGISAQRVSQILIRARSEGAA